MANPKGIITRKDVMTDDAMNLGPEFASQLKIADKAVVDLIERVKELDKVAKGFKGVSNQKEYITLKQSEALATQQAIDAIKKQEAAELSALKIKRENIKTLEEERKAKQATEAAEDKASKARERSVKLTIEEKLQLELLNKQMKQAALEKLGLVGAYQKLNQSRTEAKNKLRDLIVAEGENSKAVKAAQAEYDKLDAKVRMADKAVGDFSKNVGNYPQLAKFGGILKNLVGAFGLTVGIDAFANAVGAAFEKIKQFDQAIADLKAITGASGKDLEFLKKQAIELGKETAGGAVKVVEAYKLIASAKPELLENVDALNEVTKATLTLSKASGMDLPAAATALTDAMNQFGAPAEKAGEFIDALANGAKFGSAEIPQVTEALLKFGAVARSSNISIQESAALIELLAENGIKGAEAGTALRNVLLKISAPDALPKEAQKALKDLGISFELLKDKSVPIQQKFEALKPLLADNGKLLKAFGFENTIAAQNIIEHTDRLKDLTSKMGEYGTAQEQAEIRSNTLQGKTERLSATYDSFILSLNEGSGVISKFFSFFIDGAKDALNQLIRLNTEWDDLFEKARMDGKESGKSLFQQSFRSLVGTGDDEEISKSIKEVAKRNLAMYSKALKENEIKLKEADKKKYGLTNPFAPSPQDLKVEKERLIKAMAEQAAIIKEANTTILRSKQTVAEESVKVDQETTKLSEEELKKALDAARKAALKRLELEKQLTLSLYELRKQRLEQAIQLSDDLSKDEEQTDEMRIAAALESQKKQEELLLLTKNHLLEIERLNYKKEVEENKGNKANLEIIEKQHANNKIRINEEYSFKLKEVAQKTQEDIDKINQFDEAEYQKQLEIKLSKNTSAMNLELAAENDRFRRLGDLEKLSNKERERAIQEHEQNIFNIKKRYAIEALKLQISNLEAELAANDALPEKDQVSADKRQKIAEALTKAKLDLSEVEISNNDKKNNQHEAKERETAQKILEISQNLVNALGDLTNALFERKLSNIDEEIARNDEFYARQIELAGNDQAQKDLLTEEAEKKRKALEDKKRKEQHKQAVFNKAMSAVQVGISTAMAIMQAYAQLGPIAGSAGAILAGVMGAIQLAAVLAAPIPKYKMGRTGGPAEWAFTGDGGVTEVVEKPDGRAFLTPNKATLTYLEAGDKVHSTVDDYYKLQRASTMASLNMQGRRMDDYQAAKEFDKSYGKEILDELKRNTRAIEKNKGGNNSNINIDIPHSIWKSKNINWD